MNDGLRPRQKKAVDDIRNAYRKGFRAPLLSAVTGFGKSHTAATIIRQSIAKGKSVWFLAHLREILKATAGKLDAEQIPYGYIWANMPADPSNQVQIVSVMTAARRLDAKEYQRPDLLIIDECDLAEAASYKKVIAALGNPYLLGLTGTAERTDGKGLGNIFDIIIPTCGAMQLIEEGLAPPVRYFNCAPNIDTKQFHVRAGELAEDEMAAFMDKPALVGDAVSHWLATSAGRPSIYFTSGIQHAIHTADAFRAAGVRAIAVSGESSADERDEALIDLRSHRVDVVCNAALWIAGVDVPNASCIGLLYITNSLRKYLQSIGRGMRIADGKADLIINDHGNNLAIHGNPLAERQWSLEGREQRRKLEPDPDDIQIRICPACFRVVRATVTTCPSCGHVWTPKPREVKQVAGELAEVDLTAQRQQARIEQAQAKDIEALRRLGHSEGRARIIIAARAEKEELRRQVIERTGLPRGQVWQMKPKALRELLL